MCICLHAMLGAKLCVSLGIAYISGYKLIAINMLFKKRIYYFRTLLDS